ncbi:MAG: glycosyltransferase [bacterium]
MNNTVSVVIVTKGSVPFIDRCLQHLAQQSHPVHEVIIVDNNSADRQALRAAVRSAGVLVQLVELDDNIGYAGACNVATRYLSRACAYVLYVGPDTYLTEGYTAAGVTFMEDPANHAVGAVSGKLLGFNNDANQPTGLIDSTGIEQTWYGRWYDRSQGRLVSLDADRWAPAVAALCGTALLCRRSALAQLEAREPYTIYDGSLFMYKEDVELCLRLLAAGFSLRYHSEMVAYHCRGWKRARMSHRAKVLSARNEAVINARLGPIKYLYSCLKLYLASRGV